MHLAAVRKKEKELFISHVYKSGAVEVINDHHHSQIISCDMCPFRFWAGGRDHLSSWLIKRAPWVSISGQTFGSRQGHTGQGQGWGVMSHLTAGSRRCVWEANNIADIFWGFYTCGEKKKGTYQLILFSSCFHRSHFSFTYLISKNTGEFSEYSVIFRMLSSLIPAVKQLLRTTLIW